MLVTLPDYETFEIQGERPLDDDEFFEFCMANADLRIERDTSGTIIVIPLAGAETAYRSCDIGCQLENWASTDGTGFASGSTTDFFLQNGAARSPYAAWLMKSRIAGFSKREKQRFLHLCPDFVLELISPSDRLNKVKAKMREWIANGARLAWLIDADNRTIYIYRPDREPEALTDVDHIDGEGPVEGFRLELSDIWAGL